MTLLVPQTQERSFPSEPQSTDLGVNGRAESIDDQCQTSLTVQHNLTPSEREFAIELTELREAWYEKAGLPEFAEFMRVCRAQLEAGRK